MYQNYTKIITINVIIQIMRDYNYCIQTETLKPNKTRCIYSVYESSSAGAGQDVLSFRVEGK